MNSDARFYVVAIIACFTLTVFGSVVLDYAHVSDGQKNTILVAMVGFAALLVGQYRTATAAAVASLKADRVGEMLAESDRTQQMKLNDIKATGKATLVLVNGQYLANLKKAASALRRIADLTKTAEDESAALEAEAALAAYLARQKVLDHDGTQH